MIKLYGNEVTKEEENYFNSDENFNLEKKQIQLYKLKKAFDLTKDEILILRKIIVDLLLRLKSESFTSEKLNEYILLQTNYLEEVKIVINHAQQNIYQDNRQSTDQQRIEHETDLLEKQVEYLKDEAIASNNFINNIFEKIFIDPELSLEKKVSYSLIKNQYEEDLENFCNKKFFYNLNNLFLGDYSGEVEDYNYYKEKNDEEMDNYAIEIFDDAYYQTYPLERPVIINLLEEVLINDEEVIMEKNSASTIGNGPSEQNSSDVENNKLIDEKDLLIEKLQKKIEKYEKIIEETKQDKQNTIAELKQDKQSITEANQYLFKFTQTLSQQIEIKDKELEILTSLLSETQNKYNSLNEILLQTLNSHNDEPAKGKEVIGTHNETIVDDHII